MLGEQRFMRLGAAILTSVGAIAFASPSSASETWRFERQRGGGYAQSCDRIRGQLVCATVYCVGDGEVDFGLTGWTPRGRGESRKGRIIVDGRGRNATYNKVEADGLGETWRAALRRGEGRVIDRIRAGRTLEVDIAARGAPFVFTLNGSNAAIAQVERRCDRIAERDRPRGPRAAIPGIRFGNDDFSVTLRFGEDGPRISTERDPEWRRLATTRVDRRRDRDVVQLDRKDGRFDALRLKVERNDVRLRRVKVRYQNGAEHEVRVGERIKAGDGSGVFELQGRRGRFIDRVELYYDTQGAGPRARVQLWGRKA